MLNKIQLQQQDRLNLVFRGGEFSWGRANVFLLFILITDSFNENIMRYSDLNSRSYKPNNHFVRLL